MHGRRYCFCQYVVYYISLCISTILVIFAECSEYNHFNVFELPDYNTAVMYDHWYAGEGMDFIGLLREACDIAM